MNSQMFRLNLGDLSRGAITAVFAAIVITLGSMVTQPGFDVFAANWNEILNSAINAALAAFLAYIGKNLFTDSEGKVFGKIG